MPAIGLGTWQLTDGTAATVEAAFQVGYRMINTAVNYGTQPAIGQAIAGGVSNYSVNEIDELIDATGEIPVVNQIE